VIQRQRMRQDRQRDEIEKDTPRYRQRQRQGQRQTLFLFSQACINETLRLYPPVPGDPKLCLKDDVLPNGLRVPAGSYLTWSAFVMGRMPQ
jgi:cytochrome P450